MIEEDIKHKQDSTYLYTYMCTYPYAHANTRTPMHTTHSYTHATNKQKRHIIPSICRLKLYFFFSFLKLGPKPSECGFCVMKLDTFNLHGVYLLVHYPTNVYNVFMTCQALG